MTKALIDQLRFMPHPTYPLHMPFSLDWIALNLKRWDDQLVKIIIPFTLLCYLRVQYYFLKQWVSRRAAMAGLALLLASPLVIYHSTIAYMDLTLMYYNCVAIMLILLWQKNKNFGFILLSAMFCGFGAFVKEEGIAYSFILMIFLLIFIRKNNITNNKTNYTPWITLKEC